MLSRRTRIYHISHHHKCYEGKQEYMPHHNVIKEIKNIYHIINVIKENKNIYHIINVIKEKEITSRNIYITS